MNDHSPEDLYNEICRLTGSVRYNRRRIDAMELANETFLRLHDSPLPSEPEKRREAILGTIKEVARTFGKKRRKQISLGVLADSDHPTCPLEEADEFETVYAHFLAAQPEPQRTVFSKVRTHSKADIAKITGLSKNDVPELLATIGEEFERFLRQPR